MALTTMLNQGISASTSTCRSRRTAKSMSISMVWRILSIIVVLQACGVTTISYAKQIKSIDFAFDDTFDIDQFDEETAINSVDESSGRKGRELDEEALLQDELQPVATGEDDANADEDNSWWTKGVKRVRRELGRFFGNGDEDETAVQRSKVKREHKRRDNELRRHNKRQQQQQQQQVGEEKEHRAKKQRSNKNKNHNNHKDRAAASASAPSDLRMEKKTKRLNAQAAKHNKRSYSDEEFDEGSGNFPDTDIVEGEDEEEETEAPQMELYRTLFTVVEPWQEAYRQGPDSVVFMELHRQLETAFRDLYQAHYRDDDDEDVDDESNIRVRLLEVGPTDDHFKIHVLIQIELSAKITNFDEVLSEQIATFRRLGGLGAERDGHYYFRRISDTTESITDVKTATATETDEVEASGDEESITAPTTETSLLYTRPLEEGGGTGCRGDTTFVCPHSGHTICDIQRCDDHEDCPDGEDEYDCGGSEVGGNNGWSHHENVCAVHEFKCDDRCLPIDYQCNGVVDCADRTDEENCSHRVDRECSSTQFRCRSGECIEGHQRCDNRPDCPDGDDEDDNCEATRHTPEDCASDQFFCDDECHSRSILCNGYADCIDRSDEQNCPPYPYPYPTTRRPPTHPCPHHTCPNGKCYSEAEKCDGSLDCDDGADEANCCPLESFRCRSGECVDVTAQCNGISDCRDNSDEEMCTDSVCQTSQFRCDNGQCINANAKCDGYTDCIDSSDERYCSGVSAPATPQLNLKTYPDSQTIKESREVIFRCRDEGPLRAKVRWLRPDGRPLPPGFTDKNGRLEIPNIRIEDSGKYICEAVGYPRHVRGQQVTVHLTVERYNPIVDRPPSACHPNQATCMNGECIDKSQICDGIPHCSDNSDEHSCSYGRKCHPNQFMCRNSKCIDRIWRCDGDNDCSDNSDEESCDPEPSGAPCRYDEFQCRSGHCIPKSFQCDATNDCVDGSDEVGCMIPAPIRPPPPRIDMPEGDTLNISCIATGVPVPTIVWRLNWGHVPDKCTAKSYGGAGSLFCPNMQQHESGAYSCEIINSKGSVFVTPDTLVTVTPNLPANVCPAGFFNMLARRREDCINCFCFGITKNCKSANLYNFALQPPITSHRVVNVELSPYSDIIINDASAPSIMSLHHGVQFRASDLQYGARETPYLALPSDYMGNQLKSYGGSLRYDVNYMGSGRPTSSPDVILTGNGYTLTHRARAQPQPNVNNKVSIPLLAGQWNKPDGRQATREEIMMILANVDNILLRLGYIDATEREVELTNINMDSAGLQDYGLGSASLVEQCSCPPGYAGDSCESCAAGFVRQPGGPWLGRCVPDEPEPCPLGYYGDPRRDVPCRPCPCPQVGANNFAKGCQLGPDGEVTCNCNEGYAGRRCEYCADEYEGNPLYPGGSCHRVPDSQCNPEGTYYPHANGTCECKSLVQGEFCDTCAPESFHLNSYTYTGCIECFCSGLTKQCSSSSLYRDQISSNFGRTKAQHGFDLIRHYDSSPSRVNFEMSDYSLRFDTQVNADPLYWSLPASFLGDKVTAYGGKLNYTLNYNPMPGGHMSRNNAPDVVIKSGEDLTILHYRKAEVSPSHSTSYAIPIIESAWQRIDGQIVNREHLLMALSKIDAIYIKATYTTSTMDGALMHVSLDVATRNNIGTQPAVEVEECRCPIGYEGLSCERCALGYKRDTEAGLYLGVCVPCECNGHSNQCDIETGVCSNCADNTVGESCEQCAPGYTGNPAAGTPYDCQPTDNTGYIDPASPPMPGNSTRCSNCNQAGTSSCDGNYCACKPNVHGERCDQCRPGTYGLSERNPDGCEECYCSGKSTQCRSASLYRQQIPVDFISNAPLFTDEDGGVVDTENLHLDLPTNTYMYSFTSYTPKYWSLRGSVLGNQLYSYGGELSYNLEVDSYGNYEPGNDVILIGKGKKLLWSRPDSEQDNNEYRVRLHEDENWHRLERGQAVRASRLDFMSVLSDLEHILIRATPKIPTTSTAIGDVILESAMEAPMPGSHPAAEVEVCSCPMGYIGNSCENCAPMYYRDNYGSCVSCPCQDETTARCNLDGNGYVECQCRPGYSGDRCQNVDEPHYRPTTQLPPTRPPTDEYEYRTKITVSIAPPSITIIPVGGSLTLSCSGHLAWNGSPVVVRWHKLDGRMPQHAEETDGILYLYDLQIYDSGVYICRAISDRTQKVFEDRVSITITESSQRTPPQITDLPTYVTFEEYQPNEIDCAVSGSPMPSVTWTRIDGQMSRDAHTDGTRLIFDSPRKSDEGSYRCRANSPVGVDERYTQVYVRPATPEPTPPPREFVYIEPPQYNGHSGAQVRLTCQPIGAVTLVFEWLKDGYPIYRQRNLLISGNTLEIRNSTPRDSGTYTCVGIDQRGRRNYTTDAQVAIVDSRPYPPVQPGTAPPIVRRLPEENRIVQGQDFSITCEASGTPYPNIKWTKLHESLADNVHQTGNVLRIINARPENRGMYVCIAESPAGSDQSNTIIDIEPRERPTVDIQPAEPQVVYVGSEGMLYCRANGIPEPDVQWRRIDGRPLSSRHQSNGFGYVRILDIQLVDAGEYECVAENIVGKATATATIRVIEAPVITLEPNVETLHVTEGDELKIICSATGFPSPNVHWVNQDQYPVQPFGGDDTIQYDELPSFAIPNQNQASLEINRVTRADSKNYKCVAMNEAGSDEKYISVEVNPRRGDAPDDSDVERNPQPYPHYPYHPSPPPHSPYSPPQNVYRVNVGDAVTMTCDINNVPNIQTRWERLDGRPLPRNSLTVHNSLTIEPVGNDAGGRYRCNALDNRGSIVTFIIAELLLVPIPYITFHPKMPITVTANENVEIYCEVTGEEPIDVSWHADNNRPLPPSVHIEGQYLRFEAITPADAGRYYCSASNRYGNTTNTAQVVVNRGHVHETKPDAQRHDINEGGDVTLTCDVHQAREPIRGEIRYEWHREDGRPLPSSAHISNQVLYLRNVHRLDEGRYVCESYSTSGGRSAPSYVDLFIKPGARLPSYLPPEATAYSYPDRPRDLSLKLDQQHSNLHVGESTEVECYSSDNSYSDVVWERADGEPLPPHIQQIGNRLIISHVTPADAGNYVCKCKTDEGDLYTTSYELEIEQSPHEWRRQKVEHASVGSTAKLHCDADVGSGSPQYRWTRQYGLMQPDRDILSDELVLHEVQANDAGTYICTVTTPNDESIDYPTVLVVTGVIPHFHQKPISYMSFPTLPDSYIKFNFDITFRPETPDGLLLFNGQKRGNGDYIALSLKDHYPEFHFDFDGKPMVIRAERPITLHEWHTVRVNRFRRDGYMQVDDQHPVAFPTLTQISPLDLIEDLYIGGVPSWDVLPQNAVDQQVGFVGCISRLTLQGTIVELMKEAKFKEGITPCEPCRDSPCNNGGICLESQTEMAYTCICQLGWTGRNCAVEGTQCTPGICGTGRCENTDYGMECLCPLNTTGDLCQYIEHLNEQSLAFKTHSYVAYGTPRPSKLNIKFEVRPKSLEDAVLLYAAESKLPSGDFIAVVIRNHHVELIINTGARLKPVVVRSQHPLQLNKWTEISVARRFGEGILRVGEEPEQKAKASGLARNLYIKTPMYVGGYDHENVKLNRDVNITQGFDGCIRNLYEAQRQINLIADIQDAANVQNCGEINEILHSPSYAVKQPNQSIVSMEPCDNDPCENGGTCSNHEGAAICACPLNFAGKRCEDHITIEFDANFHGNGYLELNRNQFNEAIEQQYSFAAMVFSTMDPNGLLLWWGQSREEEFKGQDFMALAIVDGIVEFSFRLDGEEVVIRNPDKRVDDGRRHIVLIKRTDNTAILELDHVMDADETRSTGKNTMSLPGNVFIGGTPDSAKFTGGRYSNNFNGCIRVVEGEFSGILPLGSVAVSGVNVERCPKG